VGRDDQLLVRLAQLHGLDWSALRAVAVLRPVAGVGAAPPGRQVVSLASAVPGAEGEDDEEGEEDAPPSGRYNAKRLMARVEATR
jgi:hypothetical protein